MKKIFTPVLLFASLTLSAQQLYLEQVICDPNYFAYGYNEQNLLDSCFVYESGWNPHYDLYKYNESGQIILTEGYDNLSGEEFFLTSFVEYAYENGKMATRKNYNSWDKGESFNIGGCLYYEYNEDGKLSKIVTTMPSWSNPEVYDVYQEDVYTYDNTGRLESIQISTPDLFGGTDELVLYSKMVYSYIGETDNVSNIITYDYSDGEREYAKQEYVYDEAGNIVDYTIYRINSSGSYSKDTEYIYEYDLETPISDVCMPSDFESPDYVHQKAKNKIVKKDWWSVNFDDGLFSFFGTYEYLYNTTAAGVESIIADNEEAIRVKLSADGNRLFVNANGDLMDKQVSVYDMGGRLMTNAIVTNNSIDVSLLRSGLYILSVDGQGVKFVK